MRIKAARSIKHRPRKSKKGYAPASRQNVTAKGANIKSTPPPVKNSKDQDTKAHSNSPSNRNKPKAADSNRISPVSNPISSSQSKAAVSGAFSSSVSAAQRKAKVEKGNAHKASQGNASQAQTANSNTNNKHNTKHSTQHTKHQNVGNSASPSGRATPIAGGGKHTSSAQNTAGDAAAFTPPPRQAKVFTRQERVRKVERHSYIRPVKIVRGESPLEPSLRTIKVISQLVRAGNVPDIAARACGVPRHVFNRWIQRGVVELNDPAYDPKVPSLYAALVLAVDAADAQDECTDIMLISQRIDGWQALGWKRERKSSARWGNKAEVRVGGVADQPIQIETTTKELDVDQAANLLSILEATGALPALLAPAIAAKESADAAAGTTDSKDVKDSPAGS